MKRRRAVRCPLTAATENLAEEWNRMREPRLGQEPAWRGKPQHQPRRKKAPARVQRSRYETVGLRQEKEAQAPLQESASPHRKLVPRASVTTARRMQYRHHSAARVLAPSALRGPPLQALLPLRPAPQKPHHYLQFAMRPGSIRASPDLEREVQVQIGRAHV